MMNDRDDVESSIYMIRGRRVMIDRDIARLYGVSTRRLNEQVRRNKERFPEEFAFRLTRLETKNWMSQFATSNSPLKMGLRRPPLAFTEHGAVAASFVVNSPIAVAASIEVVRTFVRMRQHGGSRKDLAAALEALERAVAGHDESIRALFRAIRQITLYPSEPRKRIGFLPAPPI